MIFPYVSVIYILLVYCLCFLLFEPFGFVAGAYYSSLNIYYYYIGRSLVLAVTVSPLD